jgi:hypothetical protein
VVDLVTQAETLQVWHECLGRQNNRHVMKELEQHRISVKTKKKVCDGCALGMVYSFKNRTSRPSVVREDINADMCGPMT